MFAQGRSSHQALIEDYFQVMTESIRLTTDYLNKIKNNEEENHLNYAREIASGDKEIELSVMNSMSNLDYSLILSSILEANYLSIYSFYEKMLGIMSGGISKSKSKKKGLSFSSKYIDIIKKQLDDVSFNDRINEYIQNIDENHRSIRNELAHGCLESTIHITTETVFDLLEKTYKVLLELNRLIENKNR